jgi:phosphopantothenoylcysteine decarboxylase/phosphopantothenate--cysteine ligase
MNHYLKIRWRWNSLEVHPARDIIGTEGDELAGKRIVLGITGSVAAFRSPEIARKLMRHGADVFAMMSDMAQQIIHPNLMEWATGNPVVTRLTGKIEHIMFTTGSGKADLILIAPCTANTLSKIACGIDDTPITSYISSAIGAGIPIVIAPAMHKTMYDHPILIENVKRLTTMGIQIVEPHDEEGKAKIASTDDIIAAVIERLTAKDYAGIRVLITAGPTMEFLDPIRVITNRSSGKMGAAVAAEAKARGADVTVVYGPGSASLSRGIRVIRVGTAAEMYEASISELKSTDYDLFVGTAAAADYAPTTSSTLKIPSSRQERLQVELRATPKIVDQVKEVSPKTFLVAFRAQAGLDENALIEDAYERLRQAKADLIVANDVGKPDVGFGSDYNEVFVIDKEKRVIHLERARKRQIAKRLFDIIREKMRV